MQNYSKDDKLCPLLGLQNICKTFMFLTSGSGIPYTKYNFKRQIPSALSTEHVIMQSQAMSILNSSLHVPFSFMLVLGTFALASVGLPHGRKPVQVSRY